MNPPNSPTADRSPSRQHLARSAEPLRRPEFGDWAPIERLEPRIAPAGLAMVTQHSDAIFALGNFAEASAIFVAAGPHAAPPALTTTPTIPTIFISEHSGFIINTKLAEFETPGFKGTIESLVVRRTSTTDATLLPVGGLDFYYQVNLTSGHPSVAVDKFTLGLFDPYLVAAGFDGRSGTIVSTDPLNGRNGGTQSPVLLSSTAGVVQVDFVSRTLNEAITLGQPLSNWMVFRTNARSYDGAGTATISGSIPEVGTLTATASIFTPTETPPQPRTLVVTGAGSGSLVQVFDPATGALQAQFDAFGARNKYGVRVATGDVNGDGVEDIIAGSGRNSVGGAQVRVFDGANPAHPALPGRLGNFKPFGAGFVGAVNVATGDVDGDGHADIIVAPASGSSGQVRIFSGVDGSLLKKFTAFSKVNGGVRIAGGDLNGDGLDEVIVGAGIGSAVRVFDGLTGQLAPGMSFQAFEKSYLGGVNVAAGDVNGDGIDEIFVGTGANSDRVAIFEHTLLKLAEIRTAATEGVRLAAADVNGDGFAELIAGRSAGGSSAVTVFDGLSRLKAFDLSGFSVGGISGSFVA